MPKFRKKPVVIEATQWQRNGDHPLDNCSIMQRPGPSGDMFDYPSEGEIVRYYRDPSVDGKADCYQCQRAMHDHGWVDTLEGGHIVCPGDWIITGVQGEHYPCKPDIFEQTYEEVKD
jgi:hypothetical protein